MTKTFIGVKGDKSLQYRFTEIARGTPRQVNLTLGDIGEDLLGESLELVLYDEGTLYDSAYIRMLDDGVEVGYRSDYAMHAHELPDDINPTTPGTSSKFLERPLLENLPRYRKMLRGAVRRSVHGQ